MAFVEQTFLSACVIWQTRMSAPTALSRSAKFALIALDHYDERGSALPGELHLGTEVRNDEDRASND
jgi:hypothetical protein